MRRVICSCLGAMLIYFGVMTMPSFAGQSVDIADMENTGDVTVSIGEGAPVESPELDTGGRLSTAPLDIAARITGAAIPWISIGHARLLNRQGQRSGGRAPSILT